jgi:hypothetical protein
MHQLLDHVFGNINHGLTPLKCARDAGQKKSDGYFARFCPFPRSVRWENMPCGGFMDDGHDTGHGPSLQYGIRDRPVGGHYALGRPEWRSRQTFQSRHKPAIVTTPPVVSL